jgi:hypothetical protein
MPFAQIDSVLGNFGAVHSRELAAQLRANADALYNLIAPGQVIPILVGIPGCPTPNPNLWQECDGSEITNTASPLRSLPGQPRYVPNMIDRFVRFTTSLGSVGQTGGNNAVDFSHAHTIDPTDPFPMTSEIDDKGVNDSIQHAHSIGFDLEDEVNVEPPYIILKFFMKIQ